MELELFDFIDKTLELYEENMPLYKKAESDLYAIFNDLFNQQNDSVVSFRTRIKKSSSLKEKLLRNEFYLKYADPEEALDNLSDLIGIVMQCRFIRNEAELYKYLFFLFEEDAGFYKCKSNDNVYLNLHMAQPQIQRNGFTIYRLDGYYLLDNKKVNYELQIKALVHNFWGEIEHEVVYKNPDFLLYDQFNRNMLGAIRDNLDVVDRQLEIMYNEISNESRNAQIGMDENGFKIYVSRSVNEIVNRKSKSSLGFAMDFKKLSSTITQYIYVNDFVNGEANKELMIDYLSMLRDLGDEDIDFKEKIILEGEIPQEENMFNILGNFFVSKMNSDYQWHVFFATLFALQRHVNIQTLEYFIKFLQRILIQPSWYANTFQKFSEEERKEAQDILATALANCLVELNTIKFIYEENLYQVMNIFRDFVIEIEDTYSSYESFKNDLEAIKYLLQRRINVHFNQV